MVGTQKLEMSRWVFYFFKVRQMVYTLDFLDVIHKFSARLQTCANVQALQWQILPWPRWNFWEFARIRLLLDLPWFKCNHRFIFTDIDRVYMVAKSCIQAPHLYRWKRAQLQRSCSERLRRKKQHGIYKTLFLYLTRWTPWPIQHHFSILNSNAFDSSRWSGISCIWHCLLHQINAYHKAICEYTVNTACSKFLCSFCKICCKTWVKIELCHWQKTCRSVCIPREFQPFTTCNDRMNLRPDQFELP